MPALASCDPSRPSPVSSGRAAGRLGQRFGRVLAAGSILLFVWAASHRPSQYDEFANLHTAWQVSAGKRLYVDFFEHHNPTYFYLLAPFFLLAGDCGAFWMARAFHTLVGLATAACSAGLARHAGGGGLAISLAVFYTLAGRTLSLSLFEIRGDGLSALCGLAALLLASAPEVSKRRAAAAGLMLGLGFCVVQKGAVFYVALLPLLARWALARRSDLLLAFHAAVGAPVALMVAALTGAGMLRNWWLLGFRLNYEGLTTGMSVHWLRQFLLCVAPTDWVFFSLALAGMGYCAKGRTGRREIVYPALLLLAALLGARLPPYPYYFVPVLPFLAASAALMAETVALRFPRRPPWPAFGLVLVLLACTYLPLHDITLQVLDPADSWNLERASFVKANTAPDTLVFDPIYSFNISCRDPAWDNMQRHRFTRLLLRFGFPAHLDMVAALAELRPKFVATHDLSEAENRFVDRYYVRCGYPNLRILGASTVAAAGSTAALELLAPGTYELVSPGPLVLDGRRLSAGAHVRLAAGRHVATNGGPNARITLRQETVPAPYESRWRF